MTLKSTTGKGHYTKYLPKAFTEKGLYMYMLVAILKSCIATQTTLAIVCPNTRNGETSAEYLFDEVMYKERFVIECSNAWMDSFRSILCRFDTTVSSWKGWNYLAFAVVFLEKIHKSKSLDDFYGRQTFVYKILF